MWCLTCVNCKRHLKKNIRRFRRKRPLRLLYPADLALLVPVSIAPYHKLYPLKSEDRTHVLWQDIETEMQTVLGTEAKFGEHRHVSDLGEMKGFMSKIALLNVDWTARSREINALMNSTNSKSHHHCDQLPSRLVAKISSELSLYGFSELVGSCQWDIEKMRSMSSVVKESHNREVAMYRIIAREQPIGCPTIRVFALKEFSEHNPLKAYIISEYIPNLCHIGMHQNIEMDDLRPVVDGIAAFSAMGEEMTEEERSGTVGEVYIEEAIKYLFDEHNSDGMRQKLIQVLGVMYEEKIDAAMNIFDLICGSTTILQNYSMVSKFLGHKPVLMHSDIWPSNLLFTRHSLSNRLQFKALIDFQTASLSSPGLDIACLTVTCLSTKDRRNHKTSVLNRYYEMFTKSLKNARPSPYSREQLTNSYELCFPAAVILMLPFIISFSMRASETIPEASVDKIIGLIEDLADVHRSNLLKFPEFFTMR
ncbi:unnamed protein product [Caenorhabditis sp. 36 PRJEB53466]|nr:unnamed protein product [Caenorhabditis sp. 36 PRJEB53466]